MLVFNTSAMVVWKTYTVCHMECDPGDRSLHIMSPSFVDKFGQNGLVG